MKLEDTIRCLNSPVSRLPPEILLQIFFFCVSGIATPGDPLNWIKVTHVSRQWRAIAINCPSLWSNIVTSCPNWTEEMLRRSKMTTNLVLNANLSYATTKVFKAVQLALRNIARIKDLDILAPADTMKRLLADIPIDAPVLQTLSLSLSPNGFLGMNNGRFFIPENLFSGDTPRLQRLELNRCSLTWDSPLFNRLTALKICNIHILNRPRTSQLMKILDKMPALELHLENALPLVLNGLTFIEPADRIINLPLLSRITIISTVPDCTNPLDHVTFPRNMTRSFKIRSINTTDHSFSTILNTISNSGASIRTLYILSECSECFSMLTIQGWPDNLDCWSMRRNTPHVEFSLSWKRGDTGTFESVMTAACEVLSLVHLENLYISRISDIQPKTWITLFGSLPKIRLVYLTECLGDAFISALDQRLISSKKTPSQGKSKIPPVSFPNLQILTMEDVTFNCDYLRDCLMERCRGIAGLRELHLVSCDHLIKNDVDSLREFVGVVDLTCELGFSNHGSVDGSS